MRSSNWVAVRSLCKVAVKGISSYNSLCCQSGSMVHASLRIVLGWKGKEDVLVIGITWMAEPNATRGVERYGIGFFLENNAKCRSDMHLA